jgi:hypothetical protein
MPRFKHLLLAAAAWAALAVPGFAASSNVNSLPASGAVAGTQLFYCPIGATTDLKCTAAQVAAYNYSLMSGDCTASGTGAIACTKTNGVAFSTLATLPGSVPGDIAYWNGTTWARIAGNASGTNFLSENASGVPSWAAGSSSGVSSLSTSCPPGGPSSGPVTLPFALQTIKKTANYTGVVGDCGAVIQFTVSAAATYTALAPATAGNGYSVIVTDYGTSTGNVTITPASGTINGATSLTIFPGGTAQVWTDGTNYFTAFGVGDDMVTISTVATGNWTPNQNLIYATIMCLGPGGGGGGGGAANSNVAVIAGGGSGGAGASDQNTYTRAAIKAIFPTTVAYGVGAGGVAGTGVGGGPGTSGAVGGITFVGGNGGSPQFCHGYSGGGGGGGGGGYAGQAASATANSATGGPGGAPAGSTGVPGTGNPVTPYQGGGFGGVGSTATVARPAAYSGSNTTPGSSGAPIPAAGGAVAGAVGTSPTGCRVTAPINVCSAGAAGTTASPNGGNAQSGLLPDGTFIWNSLGIVGGAAGGGGASCAGTGSGCTAGNAGVSVYGAGGSGGGAAYDPTSPTITGGNGAAGGPGAIQIYEHNSL